MMKVDLATSETGEFKVVDGIEYLIIETKEGKMWWTGDNWSILHREDGPAIEYANGKKSWYLNDKKISLYEFNKFLVSKRIKRLA